MDDLIKGVERGVLVTRFWYIRSLDPQTLLVTGLTRDGLFLIEKGKVTRPVKNMRWNESPVFALNNLDAMTRAGAHRQRRRGRRRRLLDRLPGRPHPRVHVHVGVGRGVAGRSSSRAVRRRAPHEPLPYAFFSPASFSFASVT